MPNTARIPNPGRASLTSRIGDGRHATDPEDQAGEQRKHRAQAARHHQADRRSRHAACWIWLLHDTLPLTRMASPGPCPRARRGQHSHSSGCLSIIATDAKCVRFLKCARRRSQMMPFPRTLFVRGCAALAPPLRSDRSRTVDVRVQAAQRDLARLARALLSLAILVGLPSDVRAADSQVTITQPSDAMSLRVRPVLADGDRRQHRHLGQQRLDGGHRNVAGRPVRLGDDRGGRVVQLHVRHARARSATSACRTRT